MLPKILSQRMELLTQGIPFNKLERAAQELSGAYRLQSDGKKVLKSYMETYEQKIAYLALRLPATFAAISACLKKIGTPITTLLDAGSGPGTAFWAAWALFPDLKNALLLERDDELIRIGQTLLQGLAHYKKQDLAAFIPKESYDLAIAAYVLSELPDPQNIIENLFQASSYFLIVEPGTPYGYRTILKARELLIQKGAFIVAPCTHEGACPLANGNDWCHFAARHERTALQRRVKGATLGYEDEKYSYLLVSKTPKSPPHSRIIKTPEKHSGHLQLTLCNAGNLEKKILSKRDGELYRLAKKLDWGDSWNK